MILDQSKLSKLTEAELAEQGITPSTIRLSIGTEHIDDIIDDLQNGFEAVKNERSFLQKILNK